MVILESIPLILLILDYGGDPCYEAVFSDQGWDGLPPLSIYKVGLKHETQRPIMLRYR